MVDVKEGLERVSNKGQKPILKQNPRIFLVLLRENTKE
jgi:hypothetical protein